MEVKIEEIVKKGDVVFVQVSYPGASGMAEFVFEGSIPSEIGTEFFSKTSKAKMEAMRGYKGNAYDREYK